MTPDTIHDSSKKEHEKDAHSSPYRPHRVKITQAEANEIQRLAIAVGYVNKEGRFAGKGQESKLIAQIAIWGKFSPEQVEPMLGHIMQQTPPQRPLVTTMVEGEKVAPPPAVIDIRLGSLDATEFWENIAVRYNVRQGKSTVVEVLARLSAYTRDHFAEMVQWCTALRDQHKDLDTTVLALTGKELEALLQILQIEAEPATALVEKRTYCMVLFVLFTGATQPQLLDMRWKDLAIQSPTTIDVYRSERDHVSDTLIDPLFYDALREWLTSSGRWDHMEADDYLWVNAHNPGETSRLHQYSFYKPLKDACGKHNLPAIGLLDLQATHTRMEEHMPNGIIVGHYINDD